MPLTCCVSVLLGQSPLAASHPVQDRTGDAVPTELHAVLLRRMSGRGVTKPGTPVGGGKIFTRVRATRQTWYGLANLNGNVYPAISIDGGIRWGVDGPAFFTPGASGPAVTSAIGSQGSNVVYAWGKYGNFVETSVDAGVHWWQTDFSYGVGQVKSVKGVLYVRAFGPPPKGLGCTTVLYVSSDHGRDWKKRGPVATGPCQAKAG